MCNPLLGTASSSFPQVLPLPRWKNVPLDVKSLPSRSNPSPGIKTPSFPPSSRYYPPSSIISPTIILPLYYLPPSLSSLIHSSIISPLPPVSSPLPSFMYHLYSSPVLLTPLHYNLPRQYHFSLQYHTPSVSSPPPPVSSPHQILSAPCRQLSVQFSLYTLQLSHPFLATISSLRPLYCTICSR